MFSGEEVSVPMTGETVIPVKSAPEPWNLVAEIAPSVNEIAAPALKVVAVTTPRTSISPLLIVDKPTVTMPVTLAPLARPVCPVGMYQCPTHPCW